MTVEKSVRARLQTISLYRQRHTLKNSFQQMLYRARIYFLRIKPSNARSITGPRLTRSQAALDSIADDCREAGLRLVLFTAPVNPSVSLYMSLRGQGTIDEFVSSLARKYNLRLFNLENRFGAELWGRQFSDPESRHMGRRAHELMADEIVTAVNAVLRGES